MYLDLIFIIVVIKLIAPSNEEMPAKCKLKIDKSTAAPEWKPKELRGGYSVQPVPGPNSIKEERTNKNKHGINNQKLTLFNRGKAISIAPINKGNNKLPNPPIIAGITTKKIITIPCDVIITLYNW